LKEVGQVDLIVETSYAHEFLDRFAELVVSALKCAKGIPESGLPDKFERNLAHPIGYVDLLRATRQH
jgi:hypothetical protein